MASFRSHNFSEGGEGAKTFPVWVRKAKLAVLEVPGANADVVQRFGRKSDTLSLLATATKAELDALAADVGLSGSLIYHYGTFTAVLESIDGPHEVLTADKYVATLNFVRL